MLSLWHLVLLVSCFAVGEQVEDEKPLPLEGPNVCIEQRVHNKTVKVSYLESHDVKKYEWCLKVPPRCPVWKTEVTTKYRDELVSRVVNHPQCCPGYKQVDDHCEPVCENPCNHGTCVEPNVCSCDPGFSGESCNEVGCPNNNWGQDCSKECPCVNGGRCEPHTGQCLCLPGWTGEKCENKCDNDHFGTKCAKECECSPGYRCHHVTGDCSPCPSGFYGEKCLESCSCTSNGTALCYHENGNCFCRPNYYGRRCELFCPFGYLDNICHTKPMPNGFCSCASDLYECDQELGCVCKEGEDCEGGTQFLGYEPLTKDDGMAGHAKSVSIIATVLLLALVITILAVLYYRRRMKRMQKDLEHRSVRYIENSVLDTSNPRSTHLVVTNDEPYPFELPPPEPAVTNNAPVVNNARLSTATNAGASCSSSSGAHTYANEKNVNIDRFKLGEDQQPEGACAMSEVSSHRYEEVDDEDDYDDTLLAGGSAGGKDIATDVNLYYDAAGAGEGEESPSKEKNNAKLADYYSKGKTGNKPNVNLVINNTFEPEGYKVEEEEQDDDDETDPKTLVRMEEESCGARNRREGGFDDDFVGNS